jgi:hypothetical protein
MKLNRRYILSEVESGRRSSRIHVVDVVRSSLDRSHPPKFSDVATQVRMKCPWSRFNYDQWIRTYLPRWRKGTL